MTKHPVRSPVPIALCALTACLLLTVSGPPRGIADVPARAVSFPAGWTHWLLDGCEQPGTWQLAGTPAELHGRFSAAALRLEDNSRHEGKRSCCLVLTPRGPGPAWAEVTWRSRFSDSFDALSLWVKNPEGREASLWLKVQDAEGAEYVLPSQALGPERNWRELAFPLRDCTLASWSADAQPGIGFPLQAISVMVGGLQPGVRQTLYFDEVCAHRAPLAPLPRVDLVELTSPGEVQAGAEVRFRLRLRALDPVKTDLTLEVGLALNGGLAACSSVTVPVPTPVAAEGLLAPVEVWLQLPKRLTAGTYEVVTRSSGARVVPPDPARLATARLRVSGRQTGVTTSEVKMEGRVARLQVAGTPLRQICPVAMPLDKTEAQALARARPQVIGFRVTVGASQPGATEAIWSGPSAVDCSGVDAAIRSLLAAAPEALLLVDLRLAAPRWWCERHPGELMQQADGRALDPPTPSFSSVAWRADAAAALGAVVTHLEQGPFGDCIALYQVSGGQQGRWLYPDVAGEAMGDYSRPQRIAFGQWLQGTYGSLEDLRSAWSQPVQPATGQPGAVEAVLDWSDVRVPSPERRTRSRTWLLDPVRDQAVVDYRLFSSQAIVDTIEQLTSVVKAATAGRKACGAAYGHFLELAARHRGLEQGGHLALGEALRIKELDFLVGPPADVVPDALLMPTASIAWARKAWLPALELPPRDTPETAGAGVVTAGVVVASPDSEALAALTGLEATFADSTAEIAVIVDDTSAAYFGHGNPVKRALLAQQMQQVQRLGAPVDVWLLRDVLAHHLPEYKLYIFLDAFRVPPERLPTVLRSLGPGRRVAVWMCAPGVLGTSFSGRLMLDLTGVATSVEEEAAPLTVKLRRAVAPFTTDALAGTAYGIPQAVAPQLEIVGGDLQVLGTDGRDRPALVATEVGDKVSIFSAAPNMPAELLRAIARGAGVHIYNDRSDRLYCNASLLAIHADTPGRRLIRLPWSADVREVSGGTVAATGAEEFAVDMHGGDTRVFALQRRETAAPGP